MKLKVINIVNHAPAYESHRGRPRPQVNWDLPNGNWVGIWGYEWHDLLGNNILAITNDIDYEVWQPDLRADRIYEHTFESGLKHKLFPAIDKNYIHGFRIYKDIYSETIMLELQKILRGNNPLVLHINAGYRYINVPILKKYCNKIPIVAQFYTNSLDTFATPKTKNIYKVAHAFKKNYELRQYYKKIKFIIPSVKEGVDYFEKEFGAHVFYRNYQNFGTNYEDWVRKYSKEEARKRLNIPIEKFIFFSSSRLIPVKQIDKMIVALSKIKNQNFICYVSGRGSVEYEACLNKLVQKHKLEEKIVFIGYVDFEILKEYFQAADLVLSTSILEAGPSSPFQAAAMETPSLITDTGIASEFFKQNNAEVIVPTENYEKWIEELNAIMNGKEIKTPLRKDVVEFGNWNQISKYYYNIYKTLQNTTL